MTFDYLWLRFTLELWQSCTYNILALVLSLAIIYRLSSYLQAKPDMRISWLMARHQDITFSIYYNDLGMMHLFSPNITRLLLTVRNIVGVHGICFLFYPLCALYPHLTSVSSRILETASRRQKTSKPSLLKDPSLELSDIWSLFCSAIFSIFFSLLSSFYGWHGTLKVCLHQDEEDRDHEVVEDQLGTQWQALRDGLRLQWIRVYTVWNMKAM